MKKWTPYLLVSPYLLHVVMFVVFPVAFSVVLTFHSWNIISPTVNAAVLNSEFVM